MFATRSVKKLVTLKKKFRLATLTEKQLISVDLEQVWKFQLIFDYQNSLSAELDLCSLKCATKMEHKIKISRLNCRIM